MNDGAYFNASSMSVVRPRATVDGNSPTLTSKKAERLDMSTKHRFGTAYGIESVMAGSRGHEKSEQHGALQGRSMRGVPQDTMKKANAPSTPSHATVGT